MNYLINKLLYGFSVQEVVLLMGVGYISWLVLGVVCEQKSLLWKRRWKLLNICFCIASIFVIFKMTLIGRTPGERVVELRPFYTFATVSYNSGAYRTLLMNIFLFFPFGLTLPWGFAKSGNIKQKLVIDGLIGMGLSIAIESIQYCFGIGRAEMDDAICNTLGCLFGSTSYYLCQLLKSIKNLR